MNTTTHDTTHADSLDLAIISELTAQETLRRQFARWQAQHDNSRRLRLTPLIANLASIAALFVAGLIVQALVPNSLVNAQVSTMLGTFRHDNSTPHNDGSTNAAADTIGFGIRPPTP